VIIELIGYAGSALVILSLMQKSILKLRVIGLAGSAVFFVYSVLIEAYPIAVVNVIAAAIHIYYLRKLTRYQHEVFEILHVHPDSRYLDYFLNFYADEIKNRFQPEFTYEPAENQFAAFILRDTVPAGLFIGRTCHDHSVEIKLDFVTPQYRDFRIARYLYSPESGMFRDPDCTQAWTEASSKPHVDYLKRIGFRRDDRGRYVIDLKPMHAGAGA